MMNINKFYMAIIATMLVSCSPNMNTSLEDFLKWRYRYLEQTGDSFEIDSCSVNRETAEVLEYLRVSSRFSSDLNKDHLYLAKCTLSFTLRDLPRSGETYNHKLEKKFLFLARTGKWAEAKL